MRRRNPCRRPTVGAAVTFVMVLLLAAATPIVAQADGASSDAGESVSTDATDGAEAATTDDSANAAAPTSFAVSSTVVAAPLEAEPSIADRLEPNRFEIGAFPNSTGNLDFHLSVRLRWLGRFSSGLNADYRTYTEVFEATDEVPIEGTSNRKETEVSLDLLKTIIPLATSSGLAISFEPGLLGRYVDSESETYGYRSNTDGSISFFRYQLDSRRLMAGLFADISTDLSSVLSLDARGVAYPYIAIIESGQKVYSQVDDPLTFEQFNDAMGFEVTGDLDIDINRMVGASVGALNFHVGFLRQFGQFQSINQLVLYNYQVTVDTISPLTRTVFTAGGNLVLSFLSRWIDIIPALGIVYEATTEDFGGSASTTPVWSVGMSARF